MLSPFHVIPALSPTRFRFEPPVCDAHPTAPSSPGTTFDQSHNKYQMATMLMFPGDTLSEIPPPPKANTSLKIGPGLTHTPPDRIAVHKAGELNVDERRHALWIEGNGKRVGFILCFA